MGAVGFFASEEKAIGFVEQARAQQPRPLALEYFDRDSLNLLREAREKEGSASEIPAVPDADGAVYFEIAFSGPDSGSGLEGLVNAWYGLMGEAGASAWGALTRRDLDRLKSFRHALPESVNQIIARSKMSDERIHKVGTDMAVPDDKLREMLRFYRAELEPIGLEYLVFGHVGNSHLHVNMIPGNYGQLQQAKELYRRFAQKAVSLGGTVSAEHGIGRIKREYLSLLYGREELDQMRSIKQAFDPDGRLNPEVLL
jgi:D-lactate dehydrogenase (cytochrome)